MEKNEESETEQIKELRARLWKLKENQTYKLVQSIQRKARLYEVILAFFEDNESFLAKSTKLTVI